MICPKCKTENKDGSIFCVKCGEKIVNQDRTSPNCGSLADPDSRFCMECGYRFDSNNVPITNSNDSSRTLELVLGILGAVFGFLGATFALFFSVFSTDLAALGISAFLASIVGLIGTIYIRTNAKYGGIIVIISAVWLLISVSAAGAIGFILLLITGILALVKK